MPGCLGVALDPFLDSEQVVAAVLEVLLDGLLGAVEESSVGLLALELGHGPGTDLDVGGDVVWTGVGIGGFEVHVAGTSWRVVGEEWVLVGNLTCVGVHAAGSLTRLDVSPDHGCHITAVVHEASVEVWCLIWVGADDVSKSTREWVLQEVEHAEEFA